MRRLLTGLLLAALGLVLWFVARTFVDAERLRLALKGRAPIS